MSDDRDYGAIYPRSSQARTTAEADAAFMERVKQNALNLAQARGLTLEGTLALVSEHLARVSGPHSVYGRSYADGMMQDVPDGEPRPGVVLPGGGDAA